MGIADLRLKMSDVPGIHTLTMALQAGKILLQWGSYSAAVGASASDAEIESAVRNAVKLPPVTLIPDKPAAGMAPAPVAQTQGQPVMTTTNPASSVSAVQEMMADHLRTMQAIHAAQLELLRASLKRQADSVSTAVGSVAAKIDGQTEDFLAMMGQISNLPGM